MQHTKFSQQQQHNPPSHRFTWAGQSPDEQIYGRNQSFTGLDPRFGIPAASTRTPDQSTASGKTSESHSRRLTPISPPPPDSIRSPSSWSFRFNPSTVRLDQRGSDRDGVPISPKTKAHRNTPTTTDDHANGWTFGPIGASPSGFTPTSPKRKRSESNAPISPKTATSPHRQRKRAIYHLPRFLEEEMVGLSPGPSVDEVHDIEARNDEGYDADDELTPTQESFVKLSYHEGRNYFLPARSEGLGFKAFEAFEGVIRADREREKFKGNMWPPAMLTPILDRFGNGIGERD